MASENTLGDAYVNIMGNLNPLASAFAQGQTMAQAFTTNLGSTLTRGIMMFAGPFIAGLSIENVMKEWMGKEVVINKLSTALQAAGESAALFMPKLEAFAEKMQESTLYSHEAVIETMAHARAMGISASQLEDTTKAAIGLAAKIGVGLPTAMQLLIRASHGSTQRLKMYGIEIDQTASRQEKFAQLLKIGADAMPLAAGQVQTLTGQLTVLKNAWGDMLAEVGRGLAEPLSSASNQVKESISEWTQDFKQLREEGIFAGITGAVMNILTVVYTVFKSMFQGLYAVLQVAVIIPLQWMLDRIMNAMMFAKDVFDKVIGRTPDRSWNDIMESDRKQQAGTKGIVEREKEGFQGTASMFGNTLSQFEKSYNANTEGFGGNKGKEKLGPKSDVQKAVEGKTGEVFSFSEAWNRMQKAAEKGDEKDLAERTANATETIARNTTPSNNTPQGPQSMPPPLSQTPGGEVYAPGVVESYQSHLKEQSAFFSKQLRRT